MALAKIAKAKIKNRTKDLEPKKADKMIDVSILEEKLTKIVGLNHHEFTVEEKLRAVYILQQIDSNVDKIRIIRGELPMEVADLEDEIAGLETRLQHINDEVNSLNDNITRKKLQVKENKEAAKKYEAQQSKVKNNREFDSLSKEIEYQGLEAQIAEKKRKELEIELKGKEAIKLATDQDLDDKKSLLVLKKSELDNIIAETQREEDELSKISDKARKIVNDQLLTHYNRTRGSVRNGLAVVPIQRDACGGCYNLIPPQRQLDIKQHKKIIVCEHCGRILVDNKIMDF
ncbi:MAG: hypothetical protein RIQ89_249 [Bacteroidota bacterium]